MLWNLIVELFVCLVPRKQRYETRRFLRSLWNYLHIKSKAAKVGSNFRCGHGYACNVSKRTYIDDYVSIGSCFVMGSGNFYIGRNTQIGPLLVVATDNHNYKGDAIPFDKKAVLKDVRIGENCWIGLNVTLLPGTTIGEGAIIQAGSVVHGEIPPLAIAGGNPAKVFTYRDKEHYEKLKAEDKIYAKS